MKRICLTFLLLLFVSFPLAAQAPYQSNTGFLPFDSYHSQDFDNVNLYNLNLVVNVPIVSYPQRGQLPGLGLSAVYNAPTWFLNCVPYGYGTNCYYTPTWIGGMTVVRNDVALVGEIDTLVSGSYPYLYYASDSSGGSHIMGWTSSATVESIDASGFSYNSTSGVLTDKNGIQYTNEAASYSTEVQDIHGNTITPTYSGSTFTGWTDSIGRTIPGPSSMQYSPSSAGCQALYYPAPSSGSAEIEYCYSSVTISHAGDSYGLAYSGTYYLLTSIVLPNGTWSFAYDNFGDLTSVTRPTGGSVTYTTGWNGSVGVGQRIVTQRAVSDGTTSHNWGYSFNTSFSPLSGTNVTDPNGDLTVHKFGVNVSGVDTLAEYETETQYYQGSSTLLKTVDMAYSSPGYDPFAGYDGSSNNYDVTLKQVTTTWPTGQVSQVCTIYDANTNTGCGSTDSYSSTYTFYDANVGSGTTYPLVYGSQLYKYEYDYGSGSPGSLLRKTVSVSKWLDTGGSAYLTSNFLNLPSSVIVYDGGSAMAGKTLYSYDESGLASSGCSSSSPCGELTTVSGYVDSSNHLDTHFHYTSYGMHSSMSDPNSSTTTYTYDSTNAYLIEIQYPTTSGTSHIEYFCYDFNAGVLLKHVGQNGTLTSCSSSASDETDYAYDSMRRISGVSYPDGGSDSYSYTDSATPNPYFDFTKAISSGVNLVERGTVDGLGRPVQTRTTVPSSTCSGGYVYVDTAYDAEGRKYSVSNSHCSASSYTDGTTYYAYDALNRVTSVTEQDGSVVSTSYSGSCATVTDEASKVRKSCTDGPGRMNVVWEDPSSLNYETDYRYDPLDDLICVAENTSSFTSCSSLSSTWRPRTFGYDFLGRLTSASNPESGTTYYYYTASGGGLCAGDSSAVCRRTDARSITTTYAYDTLNRLLTKTYNDGTTPQAQFYYDWTSADGFTLTNTIGRLTIEQSVQGSTSLASSVFSYDTMGRVILRTGCTPPTCGWTFWAATSGVYNGLGELTSFTHPIGYTITRSYDSAGQLAQVSSGLSDSQHPGTLAAINSNWPIGAIENVSLENSLTENMLYEPRLQPCRLTLYSSGTPPAGCPNSAPSGNIQDFGYVFGTWGTSNNGNITQWNATGSQWWGRTYTYDNLNRLESLSDPTSTNPCPGLTWNYDAWGNRTAQNVTSGTCWSWGAGYNSSNHITNTYFTYDADGNLATDGAYNYMYDAENRLIQIDGTLAARGESNLEKMWHLKREVSCLRGDSP